MPDYTVSQGHKALGPWALTGSQIDTAIWVDNVSEVEVINPSTNSDDVWVTFDGSTPAVPGAHVSAAGVRVPPGMVLRGTLKGSADTLKLISSGTPTVSVQAAV